VPARAFTVYENGRPLALTPDGSGGFDADGDPPAGAVLTTPIPAAGAPRLRAVVHAHPTRDSFYNVVAVGDSLEPAGHGSAFGYTNAVYVDADGGGFTPGM
jgi:hypothetical protein